MSKNRIVNITSKELGCKTGLDWERVRAMADEMPQNGEFVMLNGDEVTKISLDVVRTIDYTNDGVEIRFLFKNEVSKFSMGKHDTDRLMEQFIKYRTDNPWSLSPFNKILPTSGAEIKAI
jgi:hypothetical protein